MSRLRGWLDPALGSPLPFFPSSFASLTNKQPCVSRNAQTRPFFWNVAVNSHILPKIAIRIGGISSGSKLTQASD